MTPSERTPLLLLTLSIAAVGIQALMLSPLLTDIASGLGTGPKEVGFAAAAYGVGVASAALIAAPQLGHWPKRGAIRIAFAVLAVSLFLCGFAWDWRVVAAAQLVAGLASGVIIPATYALTGDIAPPERRSQDMGKVLFGWSVAMVGGVPLAAILSGLLGWRGTFMAVGAVAAAMTLAGALLPRVESHGDGERVRYGDVLRLPGAWTGYLSTFAYMIGFYQTYTFIGDHVRQLHGAGAWLGGTISLSYGLGFGFGVVFDKWIDRKGPANVLPLGLVLVGFNYVILPFMAETIMTVALYPFVWGLANHFCMTALVSYMGSLSPRMRGTVMGLFSFTTYVSLGTAGAIYGPVYDAHGFFAVSFASAATVAAATVAAAALMAGWRLLQK
ncbi:MFS transporter [Aestuariivirga sp.]|uniref:MFS transporter n=1 Tax=Aestuariivirga sp. TaxID=2650926 RepID=UPI003593C88A